MNAPIKASPAKTHQQISRITTSDAADFLQRHYKRVLELYMGNPHEEEFPKACASAALEP